MSSPRRSARGSSQIPPSSPLAQTPQLLSDSQSQHNGSPARSNGSPSRLPPPNGTNAVTSSPLFFSSSSAAIPEEDGDRTPRANGIGLPTPNGIGITPAEGGSSPLHYASTSPSRNGATPRQPSHPGSSGSALFGRTPRANDAARMRRTDVSSPFIHRRQVYVDDNGNPIRNDPATGVTYSNLDPNTSEADAIAGQGKMVMWGTNVTETEIMSVVDDFLRNFTRKYRMIAEEEVDQNEHFEPEDPANERVYWEMLKMMYKIGTINLNLDMKDLKSYPPTRKLWHQMQDFPSEILPMFDQVIIQIMVAFATEKAEEVRAQQSGARYDRGSSVPVPPSSDAAMDDAETPKPAQKPDEIITEALNTPYTVRPFNLGTTINLRDLNPADIDRVIAVKGLVIRTTPVIPDMQIAFFQCSVCRKTQTVQIERGKIQEPTRCPREACNSPNSMQIVHNRCGFADKQIIKLQETPDNVPDGQTPHSVSLCAYRELVDFCKAGDRVEITGIFKCNNVRVNPRQRTVRSVFKTFVDVLHIQKVDKKRMGIDVSTIEQELSEQVTANVVEVRNVSEEEERKIRETAARPDVYELLSRSLAPSIFEMDDVKKGILLQLFGGTNKSFEKGGNPKYRGDINVLLCGDPSTSKSQLLKYVHRIAPRGVYTSGKGSSAVGLTAYVTRDPETRQLVLESGALVLSDGGVCCIDEFDKMNDSTRSVLHEVMEQQTVSIAKAGIITTLNARTSILASANPIGSKYNPNLPVPQNIDLPPTLLSRFDLVYLVLDRIDESMDRKLAKHIVNMYLDDRPDNANMNEVLPVEFLTSYISYARANCQPKISEAASHELVEAYVAMRKLGEDVRAAERRITATTRQLESMIRLAEAHAKMRLSETVTSDDVREAVRLIKSALKQAATDARTGLIDMSLLTEGTSSSERRRRQDLKNAVLEILDELGRLQGGNVRYVELGRRLAEQASIEVTAEELAESVRALQQEGLLSVHGEGNRRSIRRIVGA